MHHLHTYIPRKHAFQIWGERFRVTGKSWRNVFSLVGREKSIVENCHNNSPISRELIKYIFLEIIILRLLGLPQKDLSVERMHTPYPHRLVWTRTDGTRPKHNAYNAIYTRTSNLPGYCFLDVISSHCALNLLLLILHNEIAWPWWEDNIKNASNS